MGMMGIPILLAPALGPVLAGWLVDFASWKWLFLINIPIGIAGTILGIRTLPRIERQAVAALDKLGFILAPIAFAGLSYGVSQGAVSWTATKTIVGIAVGAAALILFIIAELSRKEPLLELRVFRFRGFLSRHYCAVDFTNRIVWHDVLSFRYSFSKLKNTAPLIRV